MENNARQSQLGADQISAPNLRDVVAANGSIQSTIGSFNGDRLRGNRMIQGFPEPINIPGAADHTMVVHLGGSVAVERYYDNRLDHTIKRLKTTTIIPANKPSGWRVDGDVDVLHLYIDDSTLKNFAERDLNVDPSGLEVLDRIEVDDPFMRQMSQVIATEMAGSAPSSQLMLQSLDMVMAGHMLRAYTNMADRVVSTVETEAPARAEKAVAHAKSYINENLGEDVSLDDVAAFAGVDPFYLLRAFKTAMGLTPHRYLIEQRVNLARRLLADRSLGLAEIAYDCGFCSQAHFTTTFGGVVGMPPGKYRKTLLS